MITVNKLVACTPFPQQHIKQVVKGGFAMAEQKVGLQQLDVVFNAPELNLKPGDRIWVSGDAMVQHWAKSVYTIDDKSFILVPATAIQLAAGPAGKETNAWQSGC